MSVLREASASIDNLLNKRDVCVVCDTSKQLVCPSCPQGQQCQFISPVNCTECARAVCAPAESTTAIATPTPTPSSTPSVGAIAGGVVGGVAAIALVTYLVWRYCIKTRRQPLEQEPWEDDQEQAAAGPEKVFDQRRDNRTSTHTVHSIASTVLTRASNIIQIAYIPGVTNRATPTSPALLVPPVPPIPIAVSQASSPAATEDQHFFVPGDLRDSTYSALSGFSDRTSYARSSYAPRSSVASTIYGKNAVIISPAQTGMRAKPAVVDLRSATSKSSGSSTPPVPTVDYEKYSSIPPPSPAGSTFSVGSTFLNNASAHTAMPARPIMVRVGSGAKKSPLSRAKSASEEPPSPPMPRASNTTTLIDDSPVPDQGPFSDPPDRSDVMSTTSLSAVIEEATRRASQRESAVPPKERGRSPFGDEHATD